MGLMFLEVKNKLSFFFGVFVLKLFLDEVVKYLDGW